MYMMNRVCRSMLDRSVIVFIDDILVYSKTREQHEEHLRELLGVLRRERLYAKFTKCEFWLRDVHFLGHLVNQDEILIDPAKIEVVMQWEVMKISNRDQKLLGFGRILLKIYSGLLQDRSTPHSSDEEGSGFFRGP
ncbi:hypothetical protein Lser_V15G11033 [Lactuca serriola]